MMPIISRFPFFGKRFFKRVRKLIGSCHYQHFWRAVIALASMHGRHSLNRMQDLFKNHRTRQAIADFLKTADWDAPEVLRQQALDTLKQLGCRPGDTLYLALDDTQKRKRGKKMDALQKIFLHAEKVYGIGHTMLAAAMVFRGVVIPYFIKLWAPKSFCKASQHEPNPDDRIVFQKLTESAAAAIDAAPVPDGVKCVTLFDSYYLCPTVAEACQRNHYRYVGVAKNNRLFAPDGRPNDKRRLGQYGKNVLRNDGRSTQVDGKKYRLANRVGRLSKLGRVKLVFSRRPKETSWIALATDETRWSARTVLSHYLNRWGIEVFFKMSKQYLGLGDYQLLRYRGIERYLCLVLIAYLLLTHLAVCGLDAQAKKGKKKLRLPSIPQLQETLRRKLLEDAIDGLAAGKRYRSAARKIKEVFQV